MPLEYDKSEDYYLFDLYVNNADVYAVGRKNSKAIIWKNGKKHEINDGGARSSLYKITGVPKNK